MTHWMRADDGVPVIEGILQAEHAMRHAPCKMPCAMQMNMPLIKCFGALPNDLCDSGHFCYESYESKCCTSTPSLQEYVALRVRQSILPILQTWLDSWFLLVGPLWGF